MTITNLDIYLSEIARAKSTMYLFGIRARLQGLLKANEITISLYKGLNKDIRDRSDWLRNRGKK